MVEVYGAKYMEVEEEDWASQRTAWAIEQVQGQDNQFSNSQLKKNTVQGLRM